MNVELINPFIESVVNVLKTMSQTDPVVGKPGLKKNNLTEGIVTGVIGMAGDDISGNMAISFDEPCICGIVSRMLMETFTKVNQDVVDAVGEITNMISGGAKKLISEKGYSFNMATPMMLVGKGIEIQQMSKSPIIQVPFKTVDGAFVIEANLAPK